MEKYSATRTAASGLPRKRTSSALFVDTSNLAKASDGTRESDRPAMAPLARTIRLVRIGVDSDSDKSVLVLIFVIQFTSCVSQKRCSEQSYRRFFAQMRQRALFVVINNSSSSVQGFLILLRSYSTHRRFRVAETSKIL